MDAIFLSYGFRDHERALATQVETLLESHGIRAISGEVLEGKPLTDGVKSLIATSDALVALLTPREKRDQGGFRHSAWVRDELNHARSIGKPAIALVDTTVVLDGAYGESQRINYDPNDPLDAFLMLSRTVGAWKRSYGRRVKVRILPTKLEQEIGGVPSLPGCKYRLTADRNGEELLGWQDACVRLEPGGAFAFLERVPDNALIELQIQLPSERWGSRATPQWLHVELDRS